VCNHSAADRLIVCSHIVDDGVPLHAVYHDADGEWQALCENGEHETPAEVRFACFECFRTRFPEFEVISGLYRGGRATVIKSEPGRWWVEPIDEIGSLQ
jgi:hypothetical protein